MKRLFCGLLFVSLPVLAQSLPKAREVLGRVANTYRQAKSYRVVADLTNRVTGGVAAPNALPGTAHDIIDVAYQSPGALRIARGNPSMTVVLPAAPGDTPFQPDFDTPVDFDRTPEASSQRNPQLDARRQRAQRLSDIGFEDYSAIQNGISGAETLRQENVTVDGTSVASLVIGASYAGGVRRTFWVDTARNLVLREVALTPVKGAPKGTDIEHTIAVRQLSWNQPLDDLFNSPAPPPGSVIPRPGPNGVTPSVVTNSCTKAGYTEEAGIAHLTGSVMVDFTIDEQGKPVNLRTLNHLGLGLDDLALDCVSESRYRPAVKDGQPIRVHSMRSIPFNQPISSEWHLGGAAFHVQKGDSRPVLSKADYPVSSGNPDLRPLGVLLNFTIDAQGIPRDIQAAASSDPKYAKHAAAILGKWRFTPGLRDGQPVALPATFLFAHGNFVPGIAAQ
jgi:outer membrane biosynthesis protein TonB